MLTNLMIRAQQHEARACISTTNQLAHAHRGPDCPHCEWPEGPARQLMRIHAGRGRVERGRDAVPHAGRFVSLRGPPGPSKPEQNHPGSRRLIAQYCVHAAMGHAEACSQRAQRGSCGLLCAAALIHSSCQHDRAGSVLLQATCCPGVGDDDRRNNMMLTVLASSARRGYAARSTTSRRRCG